ncbi:MAG TPA: zinc ribbon domain-containing protein [Thermodesulfobacteriota bacterium]
MPLYEFHCGACGPFDAWRTLAEAGAPMACPACGGDAERRFSPPILGLPSPRTQRRIEQATAPRLVSRARSEAPPKGPTSRSVRGRPWQISG